jgi:hypothetical protein
VTSRLTEYEVWVRLHAYGKAAARGPLATALLSSLTLLPLGEELCARCRAPFPGPVRTLDALHLAAADYLRARGSLVEIATYDAQMLRAAAAMGFGLAPL